MDNDIDILASLLVILGLEPLYNWQKSSYEAKGSIN